MNTKDESEEAEMRKSRGQIRIQSAKLIRAQKYS